jgi:hypothetical protein
VVRVAGGVEPDGDVPVAPDGLMQAAQTQT